MKILFALFLTCCCVPALGQFAVVNDKDGYCNVRSSSKPGDNIVDTLNNGHLVYAFEDHGNWVNIDYRKNNHDINGEVYRDRLIKISSFQRMPLIKSESSKVIFRKDSISVTVTQQGFNKSVHKLTYNNVHKDHIQLIDNKVYWGTDGGLPHTEYQSIEVQIGSTKITLPQKALNNLYEVALDNVEVNYDASNDILYIQSLNSDGAGSYQVIWKIERDVYKERFVAYGF